MQQIFIHGKFFFDKMGELHIYICTTKFTLVDRNQKKFWAHHFKIEHSKWNPTFLTLSH